MCRVGPLSGLPPAARHVPMQRGNLNLPVKFRARTTASEPSAEPLKGHCHVRVLSGCVGLRRLGLELRDSVRGARTSSSHCRGLHLHFPPLSDPQATTILSPAGRHLPYQTFCSKLAILRNLFVCHDKFSTILASIVGYDSEILHLLILRKVHIRKNIYFP